MAKSKQKKIERLESLVVGAGFLLKKLRADFGDYLGEGMREQVNQCIRDSDQIAQQVHARRSKELEEEHA